MKKFLTVLLALSVVFTYTVGTAFATVTTPVKTYDATEVEEQLYADIATYEKTLTGNIDRVADSYVTDITDAYDVQVKKAAVKEASVDFIKDVVDEMKKIADAEVAAADKANYTKIQLDTARTKVAAAVTAYGAKAATYKYEVKSVKAASDVSSLYVKSGNNFVKATGSAVTGGEYYDVDGGTTPDSSVTNLNTAGYYSAPNPDGAYEPAEAKAGDGNTTYYQFTKNTNVTIGDDVTGLYEDANGTTLTNDTNAQPGKTYYEKKEATPEVTGKDLTVVANFKTALDATGYVAKAEAPKAEKYYLDKIAKDYDEAKYPAEGEFTDSTHAITGTLTAQEVITAVKAEATKAISTAKAALAKDKDYAAAIAAYKAAYDGITARIANFGDVKTNEELEDGKTDVEIALNSAISELNSYALGGYTTAVLTVVTPQGTNTADLTSLTTEYANSDIYTEKTASKNATLFGVEIKDITKATRTEVLAVKSAYLKAINDTVSVVRKNVEAKALTTAAAVKTAVEATYKSGGNADQATFTKTVKDAYKVADKYADVVARGDALKKAVKSGQKLYDDAKVDEVVKAAEALVYKDMGADSVDNYFKLAINKVYKKAYTSYDTAIVELMLAGDFEIDKLEAAIKEAVDKFQDKIIVAGSNATADADKKYCKNYYASSEAADYTKIAKKAVKALNAAQSYEDITAVMATADAELAKLMLEADASAVTTARGTYVTALGKYADEIAAIKGTENFAQATYDAAEAAGVKLINDAVTVDGVKAAYEEAKDIFDTLKTDAELKAMKEAVEKELNALPLASKVAASDAIAIEAARTSYDTYITTPGAEKTTYAAKNRLQNAELALYGLEKSVLDTEIKALADKIAKIDVSAADTAVKELLAVKAELTSLADKAEAFNEKMMDKGDASTDLGDAAHAAALKAIQTDSIKALLAKLELNDGHNTATVWGAEVYFAELAINAVLSNDNVNIEEVNAALNAYNALTDRQQYYVDKDTNYAIKLIEAKVIAAVESLKITASSKAGKGYIKVTWKVKGTSAVADGYQVYRSVKKNSGFGTKPYFTTKAGATSYKNTKSLKKGTRYYYKVRAYKVVDGKKVYSDWSNKAYRIAK